MKSGSGDLDFGQDDEEGDEDLHEEDPEQVNNVSEENISHPLEDTGDSTDDVENQPPSPSKESGPNTSTSSETKYPYFLRRGKVLDERNDRLEVHVREEVKSMESQLENDLEEIFGGSDVKKTDIREFAIILAAQNPEMVAELMREEGYDDVN